MKYVAVVLAALIVVLGTQTIGRAEPPAGVPRWEYRLIAVVRSPESLVHDPKLDEAAKALEALVAVQFKKVGYEVVDLGEFRRFLTDAGTAGWEIAGTRDMEWILKRPLK